MKFLAEAEQNETLGRRPHTEHGFSHFFTMKTYFAIFSPLHKLNRQNVLFTVLFCFLNKKNQLQNNNLKIFT